MQIKKIDLMNYVNSYLKKNKNCNRCGYTMNIKIFFKTKEKESIILLCTYCSKHKNYLKLEDL
jgi:aspartate carbamoyltransferase regulatory subunit